MKFKKYFVTFLLWCIYMPSQGHVINHHVLDDEFTISDCLSLFEQGQYEEVIPSLNNWEEKLRVENSFDEDSYFNVVECLFLISSVKGNYHSAMVLLNNAIQVYKSKGYSSDSEHYRALWINMGILMDNLKDYDQELYYFGEALAMLDEANVHDDWYCALLSYIGRVYTLKNDLMAAKIYIDESIDLYVNEYGNLEDCYGPKLILLSNAGALYTQLKDYNKAEKYLNIVISNHDNTPITQHSYNLALEHLSTCYISQKRWEESLSLISNLKHNNPDAQTVSFEKQALIYMSMGNKEEMVDVIKEFNNLTIENIANVLSVFSETEREKYWKMQAGEMNFINSLCAATFNKSEATALGLNTHLFSNTLNINLNNVIELFIKTQGTTEQRKLSERIKILKSCHAYKELTSDERRLIADELIETEKKLLQSIGNLTEAIKQQYTSWKNIQDDLEADEVAIEFAMYYSDLEYPDTVKSYYGAYIITKELDYPIFIQLDVYEDIEKIIVNKHPNIEWISELYSINTSHQLYNKLWEKIDCYLKTPKTVYFTPISSLTTLNHSLLRDNEGMLLGDKYNLVRLSSLHKIREYKDKKDYFTASFFGDINYDATFEDMYKHAILYSKFDGDSIGKMLSLRTEDERGKYGYLRYTKKEIEYIEAACRRNKMQTIIYSGSHATEEAFKNLSGSSSDIIHLSTHGFVIDTQTDYEKNKFVQTTTSYSETDAYMMYSGLLLSGGNNVWMGESCPDGLEDGILTADEISRLDLSNTKLVVLSACETARGRIDLIDGVLGLQRGFKKAGAGTIVMSLWKVSDEATSILMSSFYKHLMEGKDVRDSLHKAQIELQSIDDNYKDPYYWAGFVVLD